MNVGEVKKDMLQVIKEMSLADAEEIKENWKRGNYEGFYDREDEFCHQVRIEDIDYGKVVIITLIRNEADNFPFLCSLSLAEIERTEYKFIEEARIDIMGNTEFLPRDISAIKTELTNLLVCWKRGYIKADLTA